MNGILLIDKPSGWTSMDVCARLRGALREKRVGHGGTLDPMATGLLVVFVGRATRAAEFAASDEKTYEARLRLGVVTDTQDTSGTVLERRPADVSPEQLEAVLPRFRGEIWQVPPMYSAVRVGGKRLYQIARRGGEAERAARRITIYSLRCTGAADGDFVLDVRCSKGTYIRTLCHDIGAALGCGGAMSALRRERAGTFALSEAVTLDAALAAAQAGEAARLLLPVDTLFAAEPAQTVTSAQEKAVRNGATYRTSLPAGRWRLYAPNGEFLALAEAADGQMRTIKSFFEV
ncbi:MAG: tRNA pseudouridine(55) synthase TruB [Oscillospiraceae bacterium]|nr:tRNA pseudouridine(55) synthase TruB [Oscillospiraceae bacterium]